MGVRRDSHLDFIAKIPLSKTCSDASDYEEVAAPLTVYDSDDYEESFESDFEEDKQKPPKEDAKNGDFVLEKFSSKRVVSHFIASSQTSVNLLDDSVVSRISQGGPSLVNVMQPTPARHRMFRPITGSTHGLDKPFSQPVNQEVFSLAWAKLTMYAIGASGLCGPK
ncbi:hypothetical protein LSAT2_005661 [Lamellibrachia satsuma]|nr:hypothetical protein LSAT2_005661 [Lamellibrachia satsuma]